MNADIRPTDPARGSTGTGPTTGAHAAHPNGRPTAHAVEKALKAPAADVVPHPALDVPVDRQEPTRTGVDWVVFGVTAAAKASRSSESAQMTFQPKLL